MAKEGNDPTLVYRYRVNTCLGRECSTYYYQPLKSSQLVLLGDNTTHEMHGQIMVTLRLLNGIEKQILCCQI
jgi:hypothetical protein